MKLISLFCFFFTLNTFILAKEIDLLLDNFPDVPDNQWAYKAIEKLKEHDILDGYPDGIYLGARSITRYEMAQATYKAWTKLKSMVRVENQISILNEKINNNENVPEEVKNFQIQTEAIHHELTGIKNYSKDITNLKKLAETFKQELTQIGIDIKTMNKELSILESKVKKLEDQHYTVSISGDSNFLMLGGHGGKFDGVDTFGLTYYGRLTGVGRGSDAPFDQNGNIIHPNAQPVGINKDFTALHETAFAFHGTTPNENFSWDGTLVAGNLISDLGNIPSYTGLGDQSLQPLGYAFFEPNPSLYLQQLNFTTSFNQASVPVNLTLGRIGYHVNEYIFERPFYQYPYFVNSRWQDENYYFDGGMLSIHSKQKGLILNLFGGRTSLITATNGIELNPLSITAPTLHANSRSIVPSAISTNVNQMLGMDVIFPLSSFGKIQLAGLLLDSNTPLENIPSIGQNINRIAVLGTDLKLHFSPTLSFRGGYCKTPYLYNMNTVFNKENNLGYGGIYYNSKKFGLSASYKYYEKNYGAPTNTENMGPYSPLDAQGPKVKTYVYLTPQIKLSLKGETWHGISPAAKGNRYNDLLALLKYNPTEKLKLEASFEGLEFDISHSNQKINQHWTTFILDYTFSQQASMRFGYQYSRSTNMLPLFNGLPLFFDRPFQGGLLFTQLSYRF